MAYFRTDLFLQSLSRVASFEVMIPNDREIPEQEKNEYQKQKMKTVFLLHGYTGKAGNWIPEELAYKYNFAIVMPNGENGFYLNNLSSCNAYQSMMEELVLYMRKTFSLAMHPEDTFIAGMSMGGFGALHTALAYPQYFGKTAALSSALIIHDIAHMQPGTDNGMENYDYYHNVFGDLEDLETRDVNPEVLAAALADAGKQLPEIYMCCGTEDDLLPHNRAFRDFLLKKEIPVVYEEDRGVHDMLFWSRYILRAVCWMFEGRLS